MVLAWGVMSPIAILIARFAKVLPWQNWPLELDNPTWWRTHWITQSLAFAIALAAFTLVFSIDNWFRDVDLHHWIGRCVLLIALIQVLSGLFRGTKGEPTAPSPDGSWRGDHYDMTRRR